MTKEDIDELIRTTALQSATPDDISRVSAKLAAAGWPLSADLR